MAQNVDAVKITLRNPDVIVNQNRQDNRDIYIKYVRSATYSHIRGKRHTKAVVSIDGGYGELVVAFDVSDAYVTRACGGEFGEVVYPKHGKI